jgi:ATP-dependent DNA helicase DinG
MFADDGPLARAIDQYEPRESQRAMARAVADVLQDGGVLLAEAGTGTGKTMAYLVPAILSGKRVLVSTGTKNLQEQIYFKDLPVLREALGIEFKAAYMKGRANYLCLHRFEQFQSASALPIDGIAEWARTTDTGDRAELADLPEDSGIWKDISASADTCLGSDCPQYQQCFVTRMRQRAAESDVVIVNHHLLCADTALRQSSFGEVIPDSHHLVLDEAHQLEDVATQYFGLSVSNYRIDDLVRDSERLLNAGAVDDDDDNGRRSAARVADHGAAFFGGVAMVRRAHGYGDDRVRIGPDWFADVIDHGLALVSALDGLEAFMALAGAKGNNEDALAIARRAGEMRSDLRFMLAASDESFVYFVERRGRGVFLRAAPIDVSAIVQEHLFGRMRSSILTSATLAVDGSFEYLRRRLGVRHASEVRVASSTSRGRACFTCRAACRSRDRRNLPVRSRTR